jgi:hypothetical protein
MCRTAVAGGAPALHPAAPLEVVDDPDEQRPVDPHLLRELVLRDRPGRHERDEQREVAGVQAVRQLGARDPVRVVVAQPQQVAGVVDQGESHSRAKRIPWVDRQSLHHQLLDDQ